ncbi:MAG: hypothetical protein ABDH91_08790 [Bacteroidia bacterium]
MRAVTLSLTALCWGFAQVLSNALYKYYAETDLAEVRAKTPLKWEGLRYEFSESYEVIAPAGASPQEVEAFQRQLDPRLFARHETEDREYWVGSYRVVLKSWERCRAELCARFPQACHSITTRSITSKAAGL